MLSGLTNYLPETALTVFDNLEFFIRIVLAAILGALVGLERSKRQKEAGVRTHCIIACTSALFMILSKYAFVDLVGVDGLRGADPARIAAQVVSGISFLGAGVIFKNGNSIRGLTTAAGMWGTAAVGMAIGAGMYWVGLIEAAVLVGIQIVLHRFPVGADALTTQEIVVEMTDSDELLARFDALVKSHRGQITESSLTRQNGILCMEVTAKLDPPITHEEALAFMKANDGVRRVSVWYIQHPTPCLCPAQAGRFALHPLFRPVGQLLQNRQQLTAAVGGAVLHPHRHLQILLPRHQSIPLQLPQGGGQHGVADAVQLAPQSVVADGTGDAHGAQDLDLPLAADELHGMVQRTLFHTGAVVMGLGHG